MPIAQNLHGNRFTPIRDVNVMLRIVGRVVFLYENPEITAKPFFFFFYNRERYFIFRQRTLRNLQGIMGVVVVTVKHITG